MMAKRVNNSIHNAEYVMCVMVGVAIGALVMFVGMEMRCKAKSAEYVDTSTRSNDDVTLTLYEKRMKVAIDFLQWQSKPDAASMAEAWKIAKEVWPDEAADETAGDPIKVNVYYSDEDGGGMSQ